jgi:hypothetical protein
MNDYSKLNQLIGSPLKISRHAENMLILGFGEVVRGIGRRGHRISYGDFALHIQSPWRVLQNNKLIVSSADRWNPVNEIDDWDEWYNNPHPSIENIAWKQLLGSTDKSTSSYEALHNELVVDKIALEPIGDLRVFIRGGYVLEIFACGNNNEYWRLFEPKKDTEHLVFPAEHDEDE